MLRLNRRTALLAGGAFGLSAALGGCEQAGRALLAADSQPENYPTVAALRFFAAELARLTEGRLDVEVYPSEQLGSQNDTLELAQLGGSDFVRINSAHLNALVPETLVPSLPFLFRSIAHMREAMDGEPVQMGSRHNADYSSPEEETWLACFSVETPNASKSEFRAS
ncbi:TRAP transporter substrate-binding protein DctP [Aurantiacibacter poecillastricola]|uniref:TRAP transporter substrate-binding protein DctP n=1 Tax=Aurantiacibacter poecillastricola TaxID=3064385 RepID=UPI00273ED03B|nr:TRAP transporter substrate-binding protein DctP [Aurantiacibacter sp. 219JJ12-13]MDP5262648.1 TRAP transporter substrate-binding protein DctP [Aurantiacibacter sp. 219JJ12-13]